ncbi:MAG: hypothetical protein WCP03_00135 [Candidatus Saccharibacteria bacterium]
MGNHEMLSHNNEELTAEELKQIITSREFIRSWDFCTNFTDKEEGNESGFFVVKDRKSGNTESISACGTNHIKGMFLGSIYQSDLYDNDIDPDNFDVVIDIHFHPSYLFNYLFSPRDPEARSAMVQLPIIVPSANDLVINSSARFTRAEVFHDLDDDYIYESDCMEDNENGTKISKVPLTDVQPVSVIGESTFNKSIKTMLLVQYIGNSPILWLDDNKSEIFELLQEDLQNNKDSQEEVLDILRGYGFKAEYIIIKDNLVDSETEQKLHRFLNNN